MYRALKLYVAKGLAVSRKYSHSEGPIRPKGSWGVGIGEWQTLLGLQGPGCVN